MTIRNGNRKARIDYPCLWLYRVIGSDEAAMRSAIAAATEGAGDITSSRRSASGTYVSLHVAVPVENDQGRIAIYETLRKDPCVKMVL